MSTGRPRRNEDRPLLTAIGIKVPIEMAIALRDEAKARDVSLSEIVRVALSRELADRLAAPSPAAFAAAS